MFEKLRQSKLMFWSLELLIIAASIMISSEINFIFEPIGTFFFHVICTCTDCRLSLLFIESYCQAVDESKKSKEYGLSVIVLLLLVAAIIWILLSVIPSLVQQISSLASNMPDFIKQVESRLKRGSRIAFVQGSQILINILSN